MSIQPLVTVGGRVVGTRHVHRHIVTVTRGRTTANLILGQSGDLDLFHGASKLNLKFVHR